MLQGKQTTKETILKPWARGQRAQSKTLTLTGHQTVLSDSEACSGSSSFSSSPHFQVTSVRRCQRTGQRDFFPLMTKSCEQTPDQHMVFFHSATCYRPVLSTSQLLVTETRGPWPIRCCSVLIPSQILQTQQ